MLGASTDAGYIQGSARVGALGRYFAKVVDWAAACGVNFTGTHGMNAPKPQSRSNVGLEASLWRLGRPLHRCGRRAAVDSVSLANGVKVGDAKPQDIYI